MTRCAWCDEILWPWQTQAKDQAGRFHAGCYLVYRDYHRTPEMGERSVEIKLPKRDDR